MSLELKDRVRDSFGLLLHYIYFYGKLQKVKIISCVKSSLNKTIQSTLDSFFHIPHSINTVCVRRSKFGPSHQLVSQTRAMYFLFIANYDWHDLQRFRMEIFICFIYIFIFNFYMTHLWLILVTNEYYSSSTLYWWYTITNRVYIRVYFYIVFFTYAQLLEFTDMEVHFRVSILL